jgi:hypothetical protein
MSHPPEVPHTVGCNGHHCPVCGSCSTLTEEELATLLDDEDETLASVFVCLGCCPTDCFTCDGLGWLGLDETVRCSDCDGTGRQRREVVS